MEFQKQDLIDFLNIAIKALSEKDYKKYASKVNRIANSYMGLSVKGSIGIGGLTYIPGSLLLDMIKKLQMAYTRCCFIIPMLKFS